MQGKTNPLGWPWWLWYPLLAVVALMAARSVTGSVTNFARAGGLLQDFPYSGFVLEDGQPRPAVWQRVLNVDSGSPADEAGLRRGDLVRSTEREMIAALDGEPGRVEVERDGERFRAETVLEFRSEFAGIGRPLLFLLGLGSLLTAALATVLLTRSRGNRAAVMLGIFTFFHAMTFNETALFLPLNLQIRISGLLNTFVIITNMLPTYFWLLFSLEISGGTSNRRLTRLVHAVALVSVVGIVATDIAVRIGAISWPEWATYVVVQMIASQLFGYGIVVWNYRNRNQTERNRLKIVLLAFAFFMAATFVRLSRAWLGDEYLPPVLTGFVVLSLIALALLTYAVLRQKLFDLNFALNRTLVYASVSFVLLAAFGLAKWVIEHLIPESWHAGSEYYSVGIALGLFLVLHRVHNWVERNIERFLFSPWHRNEEALRRFVTAAGHFDETSALCRAFTGEASRFAKGAGAALYLREANGSYLLGCGSLAGAPARYEGDDLALALMRAERRPLKTAQMQSSLPGALALPMLDHGKLAGFALLDGKPDGADYRPDEVEILGWAAHQVGLDLQAMHASELEAEVAGLNAKVAALSAQLAAAGTRRRTRTRTGSAA